MPTKEQLKSLKEELTKSFSELLLNEKLPLDILDANNGELIVPANVKISRGFIRKMVQKYRSIEVDPSPVRSKLFQTIIEAENKHGISYGEESAIEIS